MTDRELMQQALDLIARTYHEDEDVCKTLETITALRDRLAQPEQ